MTTGDSFGIEHAISPKLARPDLANGRMHAHVVINGAAYRLRPINIKDTFGMSRETVPTRLLTGDEGEQLRGLIQDRGEKSTARLLGISTLTQTRALSGLTMEATTVQRLRRALAGLRPDREVSR